MDVNEFFAEEEAAKQPNPRRKKRNPKKEMLRTYGPLALVLVLIILFVIFAAGSVKRSRAKREAARKFRQEEARKQVQEARENPAPKKKEGKKAEQPEEKHSTTENGRVGDRRYARGRAFSEDHYN